MSEQCAAIRTDGKPCKGKALSGSSFCSSHDPETQKAIQDEALRRYKNEESERRKEMMILAADWSREASEERKALDQLRIAIRSLSKQSEQLKERIKLLGDAEAWSEIYDVAKSSGDARIMASARRRLEGINEEMKKGELEFPY